VSYHPEEESIWALPHGEFGLEVIALVGALRYSEHRSVPEIHQHLCMLGLQISERTVTNLVERYEELVSLHLSDQSRLQELLARQGRVILCIDGLEPDATHEVLWIIRDILSGEILLARPLLSSTQADLSALLEEVKQALDVSILAVLSDAEPAIRAAVRITFPDLPHQLCQFHYLRRVAKPISQADQSAKSELKKQVRGLRPIERSVQERTDEDAVAVRGYCQAVRTALADGGHPPLRPGGLLLHERLESINTSLHQVEEKRGSFLLN
jgi:hypothetical protein